MNRIPAFLCAALLIYGIWTPARAEEAPPAGTRIPADTNIGGAETWSESGSPYLVEGDLFVDGSLTVEPGVVMKLAYNARISVNNGSFTVGDGSSDARAVFTSIADDSIGGDSNQDGDTSLPDDSRWAFIGAYGPGARINIRNADFRYAGGGASRARCGDAGSASRPECGPVAYESGTIVADDGRVEIRDSSFAWSAGADVFAINGTVTLERVEFGGAAAAIHAWPAPSRAAPVITVHESLLDQRVRPPIWVTRGAPVLHLENNWWGVPGGPDRWLSTVGDLGYTPAPEYYLAPWLDPDGPETEPEPCASGCVSSVLFLPGIKGTRLYDADEKLWEPADAANDSPFSILLGAGDERVRALGLDENGESVRRDVHVKEGDVVDAVGSRKFYTSFIEQMDALRDEGSIQSWEAVAYDWRLSLPDLVERGAKRGGEIYYEEATSTPYIEQTLRALAAESKTGRVTIIAHSNGGLVAKALMQKLGDAETARLVDKVVLVGTPQTGAPRAIGALLYGHEEGIGVKILPGLRVPVVSNGAARALAEHAPMVYHLLPSETYFENASASVGTFEGSAYAAEEAAYGPSLDDAAELGDFLENEIGNRAKPDAADTTRANVLAHSFVAYGDSAHQTLDAWMPPASTTVYQIGGTGDADTIEGIDFYSLPNPYFGSVSEVSASFGTYRPAYTDNGDGVVPLESALLMPRAENVKHLVLDLADYPDEDHASLFETAPVLQFVRSTLVNDGAPAAGFSGDAPAREADNALRFMAHGAVSLETYDARENLTGENQDGAIAQDIPRSSYDEFGAVKIARVPAGHPYRIVLRGKSSGTFSLDVQETSGVRKVTSVIANVPMTAATIATLSIADGIESDSVLEVDTDGDGIVDARITLVPGAIVSYAPPVDGAPETEPEPLQPEPEQPESEPEPDVQPEPAPEEEPDTTNPLEEPGTPEPPAESDPVPENGNGSDESGSEDTEPGDETGTPSDPAPEQEPKPEEGSPEPSKPEPETPAAETPSGSQSGGYRSTRREDAPFAESALPAFPAEILEVAAATTSVPAANAALQAAPDEARETIEQDGVVLGAAIEPHETEKNWLARLLDALRRFFARLAVALHIRKDPAV